jgi:hypothetical protein
MFLKYFFPSGELGQTRPFAGGMCISNYYFGQKILTILPQISDNIFK